MSTILLNVESQLLSGIEPDCATARQTANEFESTAGTSQDIHIAIDRVVAALNDEPEAPMAMSQPVTCTTLVLADNRRTVLIPPRVQGSYLGGDASVQIKAEQADIQYQYECGQALWQEDGIASLLKHIVGERDLTAIEDKTTRTVGHLWSLYRTNDRKHRTAAVHYWYKIGFILNTFHFKIRVMEGRKERDYTAFENRLTTALNIAGHTRRSIQYARQFARMGSLVLDNAHFGIERVRELIYVHNSLLKQEFHGDKEVFPKALKLYPWPDRDADNYGELFRAHMDTVVSCCRLEVEGVSTGVLEDVFDLIRLVTTHRGLAIEASEARRIAKLLAEKRKLPCRQKRWFRYYAHLLGKMPRSRRGNGSARSVPNLDPLLDKLLVQVQAQLHTNQAIATLDKVKLVIDRLQLIAASLEPTTADQQLTSTH